MKTTFFLVAVLYCVCFQASAQQHPLVGTWEMLSVKGIGADGKPFFLDTTSVRETKIITPTHYMLIAWDVDKDSLIFNRTMAGKVRFEKEKFVESPTQASVQIFDNVKADFSWKVEGDIFTQAGTIVRPDGKKIVLEALIFRRVSNAKSNLNNPAIGTWTQVSDQYTMEDGTMSEPLSSSDKRIRIVTPSHWMRMDHKNGKFESVFYGTYDIQGEKVSSKLIFFNHPFKKGSISTFNQKVNGDKVFITSSGTTADGKSASFRSTWEKVK